MAKAEEKEKEKEIVVDFTQSRLKDFMTCPRLEFYKYRAGPKGVGVGPALKEDYFIEGEFAHYALKHWYVGQKMQRVHMMTRVDKMVAGMGEVDPVIADKIRAKLAAMIGACFGYKGSYKGDFDKYEILFVEEPFEFLLGKFRIRGMLDLGLKDKSDDTQGFMDHKFLQALKIENYTALPLNIQQLVYTMGFHALTGEFPKWFIFNFIKKSQLRRKGGTVKNPGKEPWMQYEARVAQQYLDEPGKMFFRPPPVIVEQKVLEIIKEQVLQWLTAWEVCAEMPDKDLPMTLTSCEGMYGKLCTFGPACTAFLAGKGKHGWDAPQCKGLYKPKEVLHPELDGKDDED